MCGQCIFQTVHISHGPQSGGPALRKKLHSLKISHKKLNIQNDSIIEEKTTFLHRKLVAHTHTQAYTTNG